MRKLGFILLIAAAGCTSRPDVLQARKLPAAIQGQAAAAVAANNQFACDVYHQLAAGNAFFSPFSISTAVAMLDAGAAGQTDTELRAALHAMLSSEQLSAAYGALITSLDTGRSYGAYTLDTADRLFGQQGMSFEASYLDVTKNDFGAALQPVDFSGDADGARGTINQWVASQTDNKITELFPQGTITSATVLALANAILFKGTWDTQFDASETASATFHVAGAGDVSVPMMHASEITASTANIPGGTLLSLPFRGKDLSMVVLVPSDPDGLPQLESQLTGPALAQWIAAATPGPYNVSMPKFQFKDSVPLVDVLKALGVVTAFDPNTANLSGIDGAHDLYVQSAVHQAAIQVDEEGAEAVAATGVGVQPGAAPENNVSVDRSSVFAIYDQVTGAVLFMGRLEDPSQAQ